MAPPNEPLIIYGAIPAGNTQKVVLLTQFLSIPFELRPPPPVGDWGTAETDEEKTTVKAFLAYNPRGYVPVLVDPNVEPEAGSGCSEGLAFVDSAAIVTYLVRAYAGDDVKALWLPDDPVQSARVAQWMSYASAEVNSTLLKVRVHNLFSWPISPTTIDEAVESSKKVMAFLDAHLQ
jgi:glutathione S-transferase